MPPIVVWYAFDYSLMAQLASGLVMPAITSHLRWLLGKAD